MNQEKTAVIIGSGIGGIATSILLARNGYQVKVYEKNAFPGGRCSQMIRDGYRFDMGATIYLMPSVYTSVFASMGLKPEDCFDSKPLSTLYRIFYEDGTEIPFSADGKLMEATLEGLEPGSYKKVQAYIKKGYGFFHLAMQKLIGRNFYSLSDFVTFDNTLLLIKLKTYVRHMAFVKKFFRHPHLKTAFTFQNIYVGQNPYTAPALFAMIPAAELAEGSLFPAGGMYKITETLLSVAGKLGVEFFFNLPVTRILTRDNRAEGVVFQDGSVVHADIIVANADLPYVYRELLPDKGMANRINRMKYSCSSVVIHWGLDKTYSRLGHHSVFLSDNYRENLKQVFISNSLSDNPSFYIHAPARTDPAAAPMGGDTLSVIIPAGHLDPAKPQDWNSLKMTARNAVIHRLKKLGLDDIEQHIRFEMIYTPADWEQAFNLSRGATFGSLGHQIMQMGYFRPHNRHKKYKNLFFAGGSTHPGNGIPLVLLSAKLTAERIMKENPAE